RSAKSVWVRPQAPWAPTSCRSTLPLRLADPLFRMAPCDRASSPSTYGRMVTPDFAAPWRLEQRRLALPWFSSSTDGGRNGLVRLSPSDLVDRHHGRAPAGSSGSPRFQPTQFPVWIIACTIQSFQSRVDGCTSGGAQLNQMPQLES